ncbi:Yip1-domain-containing protein [Gonapodya prolifera JEL478]|uniref:Protein YIP n=1 Tax=Gonapodya prolifera (strain JEL478) TaxID=1344416 RepID=A0A138ZZK8_GONPJ|nr:Yip1-domain-containing protein [Gonapodya prolifera JEL478]|eukprot:KXS09947.1 Yip1-domain-containing protein [Gonapodya prolifera JEL478]
MSRSSFEGGQHPVLFGSGSLYSQGGQGPSPAGSVSSQHQPSSAASSAYGSAYGGGNPAQRKRGGQNFGGPALGGNASGDSLQFYNYSQPPPNQNGPASGSYTSSVYGAQPSSSSAYGQYSASSYSRGFEDSRYGNGSVAPDAITVDWKAAFGTGGFADEPPLLEELGINFSHIRSKTLAVLNPLRPLDQEILEDADLAGPLVFCLLFGGALLLSGRIHFGYIYGVGITGVASLYLLLNLMSDRGAEFSRTASVLGYCLLPMVVLSFVRIVVRYGGIVAVTASLFSVAWCTYSASTMFVKGLGMTDQRALVAYPVFLLYGIFALLAVF